MADSSFPPVLESETTFIAKAAYIDSPHNFYVTPIAHMKYFPSIETPGKHKNMPILSDIVVFKSPKSNKYMRGEIRHVDTVNTQCTIFAIDYGFTEESVKLNDIFEVNYNKCEHYPPLALHCELFMCVPKGDAFEDDAKEAFKFYLGDNENLRIRVKGLIDNKLRVEIRNSNPDDVSTMLALTGYTCLGGISNMGRNIKVKKPITFKHRQLKEGETLSVRLQLAPSFSKLYVCTTDDYRDYLNKRHDFIDYCRNARDIEENEFVVGKAVGVKEELDEPFERAVITEIVKPGRQAKVRLVDWGRESIVPIGRVKLIQTEMFSTAPVRAIYCSAINSKDFKEFLPQSLCVGYNYRVTIVKLGLEFEVPHLVKLA